MSNRSYKDILIYMEKLEGKVKNAIDKYGLIDKGQRVLVGLSGGADSVALLHVLLKLAPERGFELCAAHLNHGIRGEEAQRDQRFVQELCKGLGVPLICEETDIPAVARSEGKTLEQAAREKRYEFLRRAAGELGADKIAVAHHMDDQAESIMLHLIRGSGLKGLIGMEPALGDIIRPLLWARRSEIEEYAEQNGLQYCIDSTNLERDASRNRIRLDLIPYIQENLNSRFAEGLCSMGELLRQDEEYLHGLARDALKEARTQEGYDRAALAALPLPVKSRAIRIAVSEAGAETDVERCHIERIMDMLTAKTGAHADIPHISVWVSYGSICFGAPQNAREVDAPFNTEGKTAFCGGFFFAEAAEGGIIKDNAVAYMDRDKLPSGLRVRTRRDGDRFRPVGSPGGKKLKDFFIDRKAPRERRGIPMLFSGNEALFIPGYGISDRVKVDEGTIRVLRVTYTEER